MSEELSYLFITPYTIMKSRTGGVIARLLSRTDIDLVAAQMLAPTKEFAKQYASSLEKTVGKRDDKAAQLLSNYVRNNFMPTQDGRRHRVMMLLFKGKNACRKLYSIAGHLHSQAIADEEVTGETVRDTYADLVIKRDGEVKYFEPAVLTPPNHVSALDKLEMFAKFADSQTKIAENIVNKEDKSERTLVIIKPDNWARPSTKPGNIIDMFSRTGLRIIGCKVNQMSVAEALEFYGPVKDFLIKKLSPVIGKKSRSLLEKEWGIKFSSNIEGKLAKAIGTDYAHDQFNQIIKFMSGMDSASCPKKDLKKPGLVKSMVLIYEGKNAVKKIRSVLGPTDPMKAPGGTIRGEFGKNVMVNTAHASDSVESAEREMGIIKIQDNNLCSTIKDYLAELKKQGK